MSELLTFKTPRQELEFKTRVHPDIRLLLVELGQWSRDFQLPAPCVTQLYRSRGEQVAIYVEYWSRLQRGYNAYVMLDDAGKARTIGEHDGALFPNHRVLEQARGLLGKDMRELTEMANQRPTLHEWDAACDLRTKHYSAKELANVKDWIAKRCAQKDAKGHAMWLVETNLHGSGPHVHVGRNDDKWIAKAKAALRTV